VSSPVIETDTIVARVAAETRLATPGVRARWSPGRPPSHQARAGWLGLRPRPAGRRLPALPRVNGRPYARGGGSSWVSELDNFTSSHRRGSVPRVDFLGRFAVSLGRSSKDASEGHGISASAQQLPHRRTLFASSVASRLASRATSCRYGRWRSPPATIGVAVHVQ